MINILLFSSRCKARGGVVGGGGGGGGGGSLDVASASYMMSRCLHGLEQCSMWSGEPRYAQGFRAHWQYLHRLPAVWRTHTHTHTHARTHRVTGWLRLPWKTEDKKPKDARGSQSSASSAECDCDDDSAPLPSASSYSTATPSADSSHAFSNQLRISRGADRICLSISPPDS